MTPEQPQNDHLQNVSNPLKVMQPGERVLCEIKRHPFGLLGMYSVFLAVVIVAITGVVLAPHFIPGMNSQTQAVVALGALIVCALTGLFTYIGVVVYKGNRWIVTTDSITQIDQVSLFNKQTSQLSLANLEDVTVEQNGILQSMFGFGFLKAESAGERSKFTFSFCPNPNEYARQIIAAHEAYISEKPSEMHVTNQSLANASAFNQSYAPPGQQQQQYTAQPQPYYGQQNGPQQQYYDPTAQGQSAQPQPYNPTQPYAQPQSYEGQSGQWPQQPSNSK